MLLLAALGRLAPLTFEAVTVKVYAVLLVNPETDTGEEAPVPVIPPGLEVAVYPVIVAGIPKSAGAVNATDAIVPDTAVAVPIVGAPGDL